MSDRVTRRSFLRASLVLSALALGGASAACRLRSIQNAPAAASATPEVATRAPATPTKLAAVAGETIRAVATQRGPGSASPVSRQPNVLLVTIDSLRADRVGAYGFATAQTPVFDRLAREGVRFDYATCQLPQTNASHAALMTGLYPSTNGVKIHMVDKLKSDAQTLASVFAANGYQTAGIYSWVSLDRQFCGLDQGFQTYEGYVLNRSALFSDPRLEDLSALYRQLKQNLPILSTADAVLKGSDSIEASVDGRADVTNDAVFKWLDAHVDGPPFFLWVHYFDPHYPYNPPPPYDHVLGLRYDGKIDGSLDTIHQLQQNQLDLTPADHARLLELYQGEIAFVDAQLGELLTKLAHYGIADDTVTVVTADHGESFGEHGDWTHGYKVFETETRVPLVLRYPSRLPAGRVVSAPVQLIDLMPTLFDLTGVRATKAVQGTSLVPLLTGGADPKERLAFTELADESFVSVLVTQEWKLIRNNANGELQLYHLADDAGEEKNLIDEEPSVGRELTARLLDVMKLSGVSH